MGPAAPAAPPLDPFAAACAYLDTVAFPTSTGAGSTDTADGTKTVKITNIGNEALSLTVAYPADFSQDSSPDQ